MKVILNMGKVTILIAWLMIVFGLFMLKNGSSFESGAALAFYGFLIFLAAGVVTFIAKIIVSQRG